jgi:hypothetical protein
MTSTAPSSFSVGQIVRVEARTWPGINQPGGVAKLTGIDASGRKVAVRYILDSRHERDVDVRYIQAFDSSTRLRDRSMLLGRCRNCGSLRNDCGSCDLRQADETGWQSWPAADLTTSKRREAEEDMLDSSSDDDDGDDSLEELLRQTQQTFARQSRKLARLRQRARQLLNESSSSGEEEMEKKATLAQSRNFRQEESVPLNDAESHADDKSDSSSEESDDSLIQEWAALQRQPLVRRRRRPLSLSQRSVLDSPMEATPPRAVRKIAREDDLRTLRDDASHPQHPDDSNDNREDDQHFIQPEGNAEVLPVDVQDETSQLAYTQLSGFVDRLVQELEEKGLPSARQKLVQLESNWRQATTDEGQHAAIREMESVYQGWIDGLVRRGTDQCQAALRRVVQEYRQHRSSMTTQQRKGVRGTALELRETRVDNLSHQVEEVMVQLRQLGRRVGMLAEEYNDEDPRDSGSLDSGWADPSNLASPVAKPFFPPSQTWDEENINTSFDPHWFASRQHTAAATGKRGKDTRRRLTRRKGSRQSKPINKTNPRTVEILPESLALKTLDVMEATSEIPTIVRRKRANREDSEDSRPKRPRRNRASALPASFSDFQEVPGELDRRTAPDQVPVTKRMERFLQANGINAYEDLEETGRSPTSSPLRQRRPSRRKGKDSFADRNSGTQSNPRSIVAAESEANQQLQKLLFQELVASSRQGSAAASLEAEEELTKLSDTKGLSNRLTDENFSTADQAVLNTFSAASRSCTFGNSPVSEEVFLSLWNRFKQKSSFPLQHFVALQPRALSGHVKLLSCILDAMKVFEKSGSHYAKDTMSPVTPGNFTRLVVLQYVESILSLLLPVAWGLEGKDYSHIFHAFEGLGSACGAHINLVEGFCKCLCEDLEIQKWRVTPTGDKAYISAYNPTMWLSFLDNGKIPDGQNTSKLRFAGFKSNLPRTESNAVWALLAYAGSRSASTDGSGPYTRRVVSALFSRGPLLISPAQSSSPPGCVQVQTCTSALRHLASLLKAKSVETSALKDSFLINLIKQSVTLGADHVGGVEDARLAMFPNLAHGSGDWNKLKLLRKRLSRGGVSPVRVDKVVPNDIFSSRESFLGQSEVLPSSDILKANLELLVTWQSGLPSKRVRLVNFEKSKNAVVAYLEAAGALVNCNSPDAFQSAFSTNTPAKSGHGSVRRGIFFLEAAAYIEIMFATTIGCLPDRPPGFGKVDSALLQSKVWKLLSDDEMVTCRGQPVSLLFNRNTKPPTCDPYRLCVCARALVFVGLLSIGLWPVVSSSGDFYQCSSPILMTNDRCETANFILGSLISCLELCYESSKNVEAVAFICHRIIIFLDCSGRDRQNQSHAVGDIHFRASDLQRLESVCRECFKTLVASSYCGKEEDHCLSLILLILDCTSLALVQPVGSTGNLQVASPTDEWGGLDDALFASINLGDSQERKERMEMTEFLTLSLLESKPSMRYHTQNEEKGVEMSVQGRMMVARRLKWLARSVSLLSPVTNDSKPRELLSTSLKVQFRIHDEAEEDIQYMRKLSYALLEEQLHARKWRGTGASGPPNLEQAMGLKAIAQMLDINVILQIPSLIMAAAAFGEKVTHKAAARELVHLRELQRGGAPSLRKRMGKVWLICRTIGSTLDPGGSSVVRSFAEAFSTFDEQEPMTSWLQPSMENELFCRLHFLLCVLKATSIANDYEIVACTILGVMSSEIGRLQKKLGDSGEADAGVTKVRQAFLSSIEMYTSVLALVLVDGSSRGILSERLARHIVNECFCASFLKRRRIDRSMRINCQFADSIVNNIAFDSSFHGLSESKPWDDLDECLVNSLRRRTDLLAIWITSQIKDEKADSVSELFNALLYSVKHRTAALVVARGLLRCCPVDYSMDSPGISLNVAIERLLFTLVPTEWKGNERTVLSRPMLKHFLIETLSMKLRRFHLRPDDRLRRLFSLQAVLSQARGDSEIPVLELDAALLASLGYAVSCSLWEALASDVIDNETAHTSFLCAASLLGLPSSVLGGAQVGWIVDWSAGHGTGGNSESTETPRHYLRVFSSLFVTISDLLEDRSDTGRRLLQSYRMKLKESRPGFWPSVGGDEYLAIALSQLQEELGFSSSGPFTRQVTNVYTRRKTSGKIIEGVVNENVCSAIRRFRNETRRT